jgi:hypothetical protein
MIGKHRCKAAERTDLLGAVRIGLDEAFTALEESVQNLTDEEAAAFPVAGHNSIAWIVMHTLQNLDEYANGLNGSGLVLEPDPGWDLWGASPEDRPAPGDPMPTVAELRARLAKVRDAAMAAAEAATADEVRARTWFGGRRHGFDAYMRTIFHAMAHTRQVWFLRGVLGLADGGWPQQHWA